jgi:hypothetical protein
MTELAIRPGTAEEWPAIFRLMEWELPALS